MEYSEIALQQVRERRLLIDQVDLWLYENIAPYLGRRVLEIGCGLGNFARHLINRELYVGIDISEESVAHAMDVYGSYPNMHVCLADVTDTTFGDLRHFDIDTVFSLNVFEHIEDDITALRNARRVLRPGGTLILVVPAHDWLYGTMDRSIGHYRRYNKQKMAGRLSQAGLTCITQRYINALGSIGWLINGKILRQDVPPTGQLHFFNRLVPLLKRLERSMDMPFGISLLTVARNDLGVARRV